MRYITPKNRNLLLDTGHAPKQYTTTPTLSPTSPTLPAGCRLSEVAPRQQDAEMTERAFLSEALLQVASSQWLQVTRHLYCDCVTHNVSCLLGAFTEEQRTDTRPVIAQTRIPSERRSVKKYLIKHLLDQKAFLFIVTFIRDQL